MIFPGHTECGHFNGFTVEVVSPTEGFRFLRARCVSCSREVKPSLGLWAKVLRSIGAIKATTP